MMKPDFENSIRYCWRQIAIGVPITVIFPAIMMFTSNSNGWRIAFGVLTVIGCLLTLGFLSIIKGYEELDKKWLKES